MSRLADHKNNQTNHPLLDSVFAEFELLHGKTDEDKKSKALFMIDDDIATMAELLGGRDDVSYLEILTVILNRDSEWRMYMVLRD